MLSKLDYVLDLGGSVVNPGTLNEAFLSLFQKFISDYVARGKSFGIVVGGGYIARTYQDFLRQQGNISDDDLDWIGIKATKINAEFVRIILARWAYPRVLESPEESIEGGEAGVLVFSGWKPGWSTDYVAVLVAKRFSCRAIISMSNTKGVYAVEDDVVQDGQLLPRLSWDEYEKMAGSQWVPGMKVPFDPVATKEAKAQGLCVVALLGEDLENIRNYLEGKECIGTIIL